MTDTASADEEASKFRQNVTSILLVLFTSTVGLLCILVLACTLTLTRLSTISIDGVTISIWKLDDTRTQWKKIRDRIRDQSETLIKTKQELDDAQQSLANDYGVYRPARTPLDAELQAFKTAISGYEPDLAKTIVGSPGEQVGMLNTAKDRLLKAHPELQESISKIAELDKTYEPIYAERMTLEAKVTAKEGQVKALHDSLTSLQDFAQRRVPSIQHEVARRSDSRAPGKCAVRALFRENSRRVDELAAGHAAGHIDARPCHIDGGARQRAADDACAVPAESDRATRRLLSCGSASGPSRRSSSSSSPRRACRSSPMRRGSAATRPSIPISFPSWRSFPA